MIAAELSPTEYARRAWFQSHFPDFWATVESHPYALLAVQPIAPPTVRELHTAAESAYEIYRAVAPVLQALPTEQLDEMGVPRCAHDIVRLIDPAAAPTACARFDFALTPAGPKMLEVNAETPFLFWESHAIAGAVARACGYDDPNPHAESILRDGLAATIGTVTPGARVAVTALNTWREDWFTAQYIATQLATVAPERQIDVVATSDLRVCGDRLCDDRGPIDVLWRMYPLEHFANDPDGVRFCNLIRDGKLRIINPPSALLIQSKSAQAIIWGLHRAGVFFTAEQHAAIERVFLPSSMLPPDASVKHVRKPVFGREGNSVEIVEASATTHASSHRTYQKQPMLYQDFVELPRVTFIDPITEQAREGYGVYTVFMIAGRVSSICLRVGERITDAWAYMLPLGLKHHRTSRRIIPTT